jgi:hypothetical protein
MKYEKILFIPILFACYMSMGQAVNPASIIEKPVKIYLLKYF